MCGKESEEGDVWDKIMYQMDRINVAQSGGAISRRSVYKGGEGRGRRTAFNW